MVQLRSSILCGVLVVGYRHSVKTFNLISRYDGTLVDSWSGLGYEEIVQDADVQWYELSVS